MKPGITARLFLAVLATSMLVAVAIGVATHLSFKRGFLGYLNELGVERIESLAPGFASAYAEHGGWDFLGHSRREWFRLIRPRPEGDDTRPAVPVSDLTGVHLRISLLDAQYRYVAGNPEIGKASLLRPVIVGGQTVGWLALLPFQQVTSDAELRFQAQQQHAVVVIGLLTLLIAALVAVGLARTFLAPVTRIAQATHRLAAGHYGERVAVAGGDELGRLAADFNHLAHTLERNERMRRNFMADVSHELRTPLAILRAEIEALEDGVRPLSREALAALRDSTETLGRRIDDLNELSLSDAGALSYRKADLDLREVLRASLQARAERFAERRLSADAEIGDEPLIVHADARRLQQLFANLLENALRHTDAGGRVELRCTAEDGHARIDLQDSAPGVPAEALPHLFERFYRVAPAGTPGAGLGLAICRNIVEAHGGQIGAQPSPLGGLRIWLRLPLATP